MNKFISYSIFIFLLISCGNQNQNTNNLINAGAEINTVKWIAENIYFEKYQDFGEITLSSENQFLIIKLKNISEGKFNLDSITNNAIFHNNNESFLFTNGFVEISTLTENKISGKFEIFYKSKDKNLVDFNITNGFFSDVLFLTNNIADENKISKSKFMEINSKTGEISIEETNIEINYNNNKFSLKFENFADKNLNLDIKNIDITNGTEILHINNGNIKTIIINKLKNKQIDIVFKNGKTITLL
ncbi:MAG: hypothetical protein JXR51_03105 [Bacteroidales bacterium]|nr:hypothetical protein [Bacteroidales bacterium]MBN2756139.1 hypothetical protein [Bacteroidales bacterium]